MQAHVNLAMGEHLDFACTKLNSTLVKLDETQKDTRRLEEKVEALQKQLEKKGYKERASNTTRFVWKINKFSDILKRAKAGLKGKIESDPFYTDSYGYKLKVLLNPNGCWPSGWDTHMSVSIIVMKGEYDAILPWPFRNKVTITLIDQEEDPIKRQDVVYCVVPMKERNFARPQKEENTGYGYPEFVSHEELRSRRYLVEDSLFLQVDVGSSL